MKKHKILLTILFLLVILFLYQETCFAEITSSGIMDSVLEKYYVAAQSWGSTIKEHATKIFFYLVAISMVWQFSQLLFHRSSVSELFGETIRFLTFIGFFLWILRNGPEIASSIITSLIKIGESASGQNTFSPSSIVDIGFKIFDNICENLSIWSPVESAITALTAIIILIILALIAINMMLQLCSAWVLAYAGIFFLGFGGSKWTSDMAINYFKTVLGIGVSLMTMVLLVGIGSSIITSCQQQMSTTIKLQELSILLVVSLTLFMLVDKLPSMVAGIITGASIGSSGIGSFGAGAAIGAAMTGMSAAASSMAGSASLIAKTVTGGAGLASAFKAAKESLISSNMDNFNKSNAKGGISSESLGFVKPPSATAVVGKMAGAAISSGFNKATENSFGGKLAKTISGKDKENTDGAQDKKN
ncbi:MAG: P-type conjugative transfer protein TrbL [Bilophila wadsworthia]|uniref:P-type conjugative transfer protein TrbL n=1 Tax=Bilophila wadsworthia TaxID=35833 RepID=UPI002908E068|nr:P-type conjugative transfer protein TrbL [Bilophila wadsworthia]MDU4375215.1 P-type conjugative transfer protein TrbL [Bilophila wadsworthia]